MESKKKYLIVIAGPTAVGKTSMAIELALHFKTEIISADSRQLYKELTIGTAKPSPEELAQVKHHLINTRSISENYSAGKFELEAKEVLSELFKKTSIVLLVGGSGLYVSALMEGLDEMPEFDPVLRERLNSEWENHGLEPLLKELETADPVYFNKVDRKNPRRIIRALELIRSTGRPYSSWLKTDKKQTSLPYEVIGIGLERERALLYERIDQRMDLMIDHGLFEEAQQFLSYQSHPALQTVGYSEVFGYLEGNYDYDECIRLLKRNSRRYAKRQLTWFKNRERLKWFDAGDFNGILGYLKSVLSH